MTIKFTLSNGNHFFAYDVMNWEEANGINAMSFYGKATMEKVKECKNEESS